MLKLHKDDIDRFEAAVTVAGTAGSEKMARLILEFPNRKLMFDGVFRDNKVLVEIPKLMDVQANAGVCRLEIIADRTYFEAYTSDFELTMKKSVEVDDVSVVRTEPISIVVEDINLEKEQEDIFLPDCSEKNRSSALNFIQKFTDDQELLEDYPDAVRTWAEGVFVNPQSHSAQIAMTMVAMRLSN